ASFLSATGGTFTRASIGTYYDSTGTLQTAASGLPRFDYDPVTHAAKGILIEEERTNLLTYSSRMDHAAWSFSGTKTIGEIAPDGSSDGTTLSGPTVPTTAHRIITPAITSTSVTYSVFAKFLSGPPVKIFLLRNNTTATNFDGCGFNLSTGSNTSPCTGWVIYALNNGWYRLSYTRTTGISIGDTLVVYFGKTGQSTAAGESWAVWGAQLEAGAFATSYIPTTTTTVTRAIDNLYLPKGSWANNNLGTFQIEAFKAPAQGVASRYYSLGNNIGQISLNNDATVSGNISAYVTDAIASNVATLTTTGLTVGSSFKSVTAYATNDFGLSTNGGTIQFDTSGTFPNFTFLSVGNLSSNGVRPINSNIKQLKYYPSRVPNTQLQLLTQ
ncbi:MAG: hypothetical protein JNL76_04805, partial [Alphaproteobacteria bacterium]|nr:hypothetical protein [Alphaproteobacteria bacterium]